MDKELCFFRQDLHDEQDTVRLHHVNLVVMWLRRLAAVFECQLLRRDAAATNYATAHIQPAATETAHRARFLLLDSS